MDFGTNTGCYRLTQPTCSVYPYNGETRTIDRASPVADMRSVCLHPLCRCRWDDPLHVYCAVRSRSLEGQGKARHIVPIADPNAAVASGGDVCYVELAHFNYREGYYIFCPGSDILRLPRVSCTELPPDTVASAVWEHQHRMMTYRDTVGAQFERYNDDGNVERNLTDGSTMTSFDRLSLLFLFIFSMIC